VYELSAAVGGKVVSVEVIEGQTVAELDDIVALDSARGPVLLATQVPGVVRELYVERNTVIEAGALIALIDES
jgi:multidrug efflux pump subunit AcrA (membrane-fusion protein)